MLSSIGAGSECQLQKQKGIELRYVPDQSYGVLGQSTTAKGASRLAVQLFAVRLYRQKATYFGGAWRRTRITNTEQVIKLCVYDTGLGIADHQQHEIFSQFHQLESNNKGEGIGLGQVNYCR